MKPPMDSCGNSGGGVDLMLGNFTNILIKHLHGGRAVRIGSGDARQSRKFWEDLKGLCDESISKLKDEQS